MTSTSHITPAAGVRPEQAPLGSAVPNVPHAISVSLPTFRDNVDYEEGAPRVVNAMVSGYPRFFVNLKVKEVIYCSGVVVTVVGGDWKERNGLAQGSCLSFLTFENA